MIERLNFYDVYGYLLPGIVLLGFLWFPLWFLAGYNVPAEWSSAFAALALGYITGHLLQRLAREALPQGVAGRYPSDYLLDDTEDWIPENYPDGLRRQHLSEEMKRRLTEAISQRFALDVRGDAAESKRRHERQDAFLLCRRTLLQSGAGSYAEQFEGMYALMRGLAAAATLASFYYLGWGLGSAANRLPPASHTIISIGLTVSVIVAAMILGVRGGDRSWAFWLLTAALFATGVLAGLTYAVSRGLSPERVLVLTLAVLIVRFAEYHFEGAYRFFAVAFAATVYRDFYVLTVTSERTEHMRPPSFVEWLIGRRA